MRLINKLLIHLIGMKGTKKLANFLGTKDYKTHSEFCDIIAITIEEIIGSKDNSLQSLILSWCATLPWAYFESLFIKKKSWNISLVKVFNNVEIVNGTDCALITQAFCLWHLERLINNAADYKKFSMKEIEQFINNEITKGTFIIEKLDKFRQDLRDLLLPDDWYLRYVIEILNVIYNKGDKLSSIVNFLECDPKLRLGLMTLSIEMIKSTKQVDKHS